MRAIFSRVKLKEKQIWLLAVLVLFAAVAEMILPSLLAQMINSGVADSSRSTVLSLSAVMAGVTLLACIVNFLSVKIASRISTDFSATLRGQVFEKVQSFSAAELDISYQRQTKSYDHQMRKGKRLREFPPLCRQWIYRNKFSQRKIT